MKGCLIKRPLTLREVAEEAGTYREFGMHLKDFLHEFAQAKERNQPLPPMLAEEPQRLSNSFHEGSVCDSFLAATADYLSRMNRIPTPLWALGEDRVLDKPWFADDFPAVRLLLLRDTPSAFKDKNVFTFDSALKVA
ncbi:MAG: hypothetical protein L0Z50_26205 [Verrucomicrobiales bacterium]|nr:hypothetical protein [Verrucomicrobiales bacterium]